MTSDADARAALVAAITRLQAELDIVHRREIKHRTEDAAMIEWLREKYPTIYEEMMKCALP
jgi:uncharacterized membrane-anchored protein YhcB (DUF1043 family)